MKNKNFLSIINITCGGPVKKLAINVQYSCDELLSEEMPIATSNNGMLKLYPPLCVWKAV